MKDKGLQIAIIVLLVVLICVVVFFGYKNMANNSSKDKDTEEKEKKKDKEDKKEKLEDASKEDIELMLKVSREFYDFDKDGGSFDKLVNQDKINLLLKLEELNLFSDKVTGQRLKDAAKKYFGDDVIVLLEDIKCSAYDSLHKQNPEEGMMVKYDSQSDTYIYNDNHPGHGGGSMKSVYSHLYLDNIEKEDNKYLFKIKAYYTEEWRNGDTYGPKTKDDNIYLTYDNAGERTNAFITNVSNTYPDICTSEYMDEINANVYECDYDKLYEKIKKNLKTSYTFIFTRDSNNNLIFEEYKVN